MQFYPENPKQIELITDAALKAGFTGGVVVDYPNSSKAKKLYLTLFKGNRGRAEPLPEGLQSKEDQVTVEKRAR